MRGVRFKAYPSSDQKQILSQWMGSARVIWNAKCREEEYYRTFAYKYYPVGTFAPIALSQIFWHNFIIANFKKIGNFIKMP